MPQRPSKQGLALVVPLNYDRTVNSRLSAFVDEYRRVQPLQAWRAMRALMSDPEDTGQVFKIIQALKGGALARAVRRLEAMPGGRELLRDKPDVLALLNDREALRAMPQGSVGRAYLSFVESQDISADGLVAASEEAPRGLEISAGERWLSNRLRDIHDLQHVICGYGRDELGELCLLAFMVAQTPNRGIAFIVFMGRRQFRRELPHVDVDACVAEGRRMGERAQWFAAIDWERRLAEPLPQLREELGVEPPGLYRHAITTLGGAAGATA